MEQALLIDSDLSGGDGEYELLKALGLLDDEFESIHTDEDWDDWDEWDEDSDSSQNDYWDPSRMYTEWDYLAYFGDDAWNKLYQAQLARHHNILLRLFTRRLLNLSEHERNGLFDAFSRSREFGIDEHNSLLDALAHPK